MQNKAILFAAVLAVVFALTSVSALYVCDDTQTILKLGAVDNAHSELYNGSLYSLRLCYSDVYGMNYTLANPHTCNIGNTVAKLAQVTNSHLEAPNGTIFTNLACYGDLSCSIRTGSCLTNENLVLTLAQQTNSHAAFNNTLPFKLCCSSAFALASVNTTNSSFGSITGFVINAPINGSTYNNFVPIDMTLLAGTSANFSINSGAIVPYVSVTSISLSAGSHSIVIQATNGTSFLQRTIFFNILNATSSSSSSSSGGGKGVRAGKSSTSQPGQTTLSESDEPIFLETAEKSKTFFSLTSLQLVGTIIFLLIILILLTILFTHKKNRNN